VQSLYDPNLLFPINPDLSDPNFKVCYAIELYKPYLTDSDPNGWLIRVENNADVLIDWPVNSQFHIVWLEDANAPPDKRLPPAAGGLDPNSRSTNIKFRGNQPIRLKRPIGGGGYIVVDEVPTPAGLDGGWLVTNPVTDWVARSFKRNINPHKCISRIWDSSLNEADITNLGGHNLYGDPNLPIQAHPANEDFRCVGEIGKVLAKSGYMEGGDVIGPNDTEATALVDLANPNFQKLFNYLTVFDPTNDNIDNDGDGLGAAGADPNELKIAGRININTAPWYVLAQLPWVRPELAQAIVAHRDTNPGGGFKSIGELNNIVNTDADSSIDYYKQQTGDLIDFPDLTGDDKAIDDFEERDIIFHRISNLVTVRSDVFTAYILVRIGKDGPQKRVIAILDRSNVSTPEDKVKLRALYPVPDPR
jgi:hypothetical protein